MVNGGGYGGNPPPPLVGPPWCQPCCSVPRLLMRPMRGRGMLMRGKEKGRVLIKLRRGDGGGERHISGISGFNALRCHRLTMRERAVVIAGGWFPWRRGWQCEAPRLLPLLVGGGERLPLRDSDAQYGHGPRVTPVTRPCDWPVGIWGAVPYCEDG